MVFWPARNHGSICPRRVLHLDDAFPLIDDLVSLFVFLHDPIDQLVSADIERRQKGAVFIEVFEMWASSIGDSTM
jgi:hypothetical protein